MTTHHQVRNWNRTVEMKAMKDCLRNFRFIAMDTEYPGCLKETPRDASDLDRYTNMKFSVDRTNLIQLGITLFDLDGTIGGTWEINFRDFGYAGNPKSLEFLKRNGMDLDKIREEGIGYRGFFKELTWILKQGTDMTWVTFHGSYDLAYLLKNASGGEPLPLTSELFSESLGTVLGGPVYDLKILAGRYEGLTSRMGLEALANAVGVSRHGSAHHAGSDTELTARVFIQMSEICPKLETAQGMVYGLAHDIISSDSDSDRRPPREFHHRLHSFHHMMMMGRFYGPPPPPPPPRPMVVPPRFRGRYVSRPPRLLMC